MRNIIDTLAEAGEDFEVAGAPQGEECRLVDFYRYASKNLDAIPWNSLEKMGWIEKGRKISSLAPLVESFMEGGGKRALFRKAENTNDFLVSFWVSRVETKAKEVVIRSPGLKFVQEAFGKEALFEISRLTRTVSVIRTLPEILAKYGIILVYEKGVPGIKSDGVVTKLSNGIPVIGMTIRYSRLDYFWFTLLHELSHIILHYNTLDSPVVEDIDSQTQVKAEREADMLSMNTLIPRLEWYRFPKYAQNDLSIIKFAEKVGVHPAIVAGRLRKETGHYQRHSQIVNEIDVNTVIWR
ncbi:ImmA/IrrE family metallo-endopeptidase [Geomonas anaerohicana]|uniref:ImmA/IrrE family metallo-endopeptidase n=1 Tax=Geomonas anaerohicana TaxID=2798583 RepID=A0ABS0YK21_9BACT|nr:ImmA/IrrE family metallo-endopeptidase [Geomonas anaerohicana]MBJ6752697.1 ImmA/IrrE family metallo-endopeptidase [Geomonas anaerohicana]